MGTARRLQMKVGRVLTALKNDALTRAAFARQPAHVLRSFGIVDPEDDVPTFAARVARFAADLGEDELSGPSDAAVDQGAGGGGDAGCSGMLISDVGEGAGSGDSDDSSCDPLMFAEDVLGGFDSTPGGEDAANRPRPGWAYQADPDEPPDDPSEEPEEGDPPTPPPEPPPCPNGESCPRDEGSQPPVPQPDDLSPADDPYGGGGCGVWEGSCLTDEGCEVGEGCGPVVALDSTGCSGLVQAEGCDNPVAADQVVCGNIEGGCSMGEGCDAGEGVFMTPQQERGRARLVTASPPTAPASIPLGRNRATAASFSTARTVPERRLPQQRQGGGGASGL